MAKRINRELGDIIIVLSISVVPPLLYILQHYFDTVSRSELTVETCSISFLNSFIITASLFYGCRFIFGFLNKHMPWEKYGVKRVIPEVLIVFTYTSITQFLIVWVFSGTSLYDYHKATPANYFDDILFGNTITLIVVAIIEGVYLFRRWKESLVQTEKLKSENLKSQFDSLKAQLDPHFMFNSLNVLSSLVRKDPEKAEHFIDDFAKVYRYVLEVKNEMVVPLHRELQVLDSYLNLQKIRFGDGIIIKRDIHSEHLDQYVPPLSLQELVSNAIKHNEASLKNPLVIEIKSTENGIIIENNLQLRSEKISSTGTGLTNLRERYRLLTSHRPVFRILDRHYKAEIPLIEAEA